MTDKQPVNFKVPLKNIELPKEWNRMSPSGIAGLSRSLKLLGQLVALVVKPGSKKDTYILKDGRRRIMAMKEIGMKDAFVTIDETEGDETRDVTVSLVANIHREGHTPLEMAKSLQAMVDGGMKAQEIALATDLKQSFISQHRSLLKLPEGTQEALANGKISFSTARALVKLNLEKQSHVNKFNDLHDKAVEGASSQDIENRVERFLDREKQKVEAKKAKKAKDKGEKVEEAPPKKEQGRPVAKMRDYEKMRSKITAPTKTALIDALKLAEEKRVGSTSKMRRKYLEGKRDMAEELAGLRD